MIPNNSPLEHLLAFALIFLIGALWAHLRCSSRDARRKEKRHDGRLSTLPVVTRNHARKAGGTIGAIAGAASGFSAAMMKGAHIGGTLGGRLGVIAGPLGLNRSRGNSPGNLRPVSDLDTSNLDFCTVAGCTAGVRRLACKNRLCTEHGVIAVFKGCSQQFLDVRSFGTTRAGRCSCAAYASSLTVMTTFPQHHTELGSDAHVCCKSPTTRLKKRFST